jgi:CDP-2,3-bis-(O-geranylgeranyl)-sn-glycerol synthase
MGIMLFILQTFYFMLPAYFANMAPVIVRKWFKYLAKPIDCGYKIKGEPILGKNKTWRGVIFGIIFGIIISFIQFKLKLSINIVDYSNWYLLGGLMGFGAIFGDALKSVIKRRMHIKPGMPFIPWDQVDFVFGAFMFSFFLIPITIRFQVIITAIIVSPLLHILTNHVAYYAKIRNEKW